MQLLNCSAHTAQLIDEEIRSLLVEAHDRAAEIINENRDTHALIAEALLKYETLDAAQIKSIYETGKMPVDSLEDSEEDNHALSFDEVKERLENKNKDEEEQNFLLFFLFSVKRSLKNKLALL